MASPNDQQWSQPPQSETDVDPSVALLRVSSNVINADEESPSMPRGSMDSSLATGAERFLRIAADASAPSVPVEDQPAPMDVVADSAAAPASTRVDLSPTSPVGTDADIPITEVVEPVAMEDAPPSAASLPLTAQPKTTTSLAHSQAPPPGFRASPKPTPLQSHSEPAEVYVDA